MRNKKEQSVDKFGLDYIPNEDKNELLENENKRLRSQLEATHKKLNEHLKVKMNVEEKEDDEELNTSDIESAEPSEVNFIESDEEEEVKPKRKEVKQKTRLSFIDDSDDEDKVIKVKDNKIVKKLK